MKGFLLIATSHPYYGRMAANLAASIKAADPDANIAVVTDSVGLKHLNDAEKGLFTRIINTTDAGVGVGGVMRLRMNLPDWSPWEETIAMDVDTIWLPKADPEACFALLKDRDFTIVNEGYTDLDTGEKVGNKNYTYWGNVDDIKEAYGISGKFWQCRGEFIVFRKTEAVEEMYAIARDILNDPKVTTQKLAGAVTDEFALNVALNICNIEPHQVAWQPAFWPAMRGHIPPIYQLGNYFAVSFGGNNLTDATVRAHKIIAGNAARVTGVPYRFHLHPKRNFLQERRHN